MSLPEFFTAVLRASFLGNTAVLLMLAIRRLAGKTLSPPARCWLWLPVAALFVMPRLPDLGLAFAHGVACEVIQRNHVARVRFSSTCLSVVSPTLEAKVVMAAQCGRRSIMDAVGRLHRQLWPLGAIGLPVLVAGGLMPWWLRRVKTNALEYRLPQSHLRILARCLRS